MISVSAALQQETLTDLFNLPLSQIAYSQLLNLQHIREAMTLQNSNDIWSHDGNGTGFSSSKFYHKLSEHPQTDPLFRRVWESFCQPKHKVFCWLLLKDRLSMRNILKRKHMVLDSFACELCLRSTEKTSDHLFLHCAFAQQCWGIINLATDPNTGIFDNFNSFRLQLSSQFSLNAIILVLDNLDSQK